MSGDDEVIKWLSDSRHFLLSFKEKYHIKEVIFGANTQKFQLKIKGEISKFKHILENEASFDLISEHVL